MSSLAITSGRLTMVRRRAATSLLDICQIGVKSGGAWGADPGDKTWTYGSAIACGVDLSGQSESADGAQAPQADATITLPHGTTVTAADRIKVTYRLGADVTDLEYTISGTPRHGLYGLVCVCQLVTGTSGR